MKKNDRVRLLCCTDPYTRLEPGTPRHGNPGRRLGHGPCAMGRRVDTGHGGEGPATVSKWSPRSRAVSYPAPE
jgi:hypothetical protein